MTDDKEERIITNEQYFEAWIPVERSKEKWNRLRLAPKHTDEDYWNLWTERNKESNKVEKLQARIKELESELEKAKADSYKEHMKAGFHDVEEFYHDEVRK